MFDYNDPAIAQYLPSYLSQQSYSQAGGTSGGYAPWVSNQIQKGMQNAMYSQYDPRFFQGQTDFTNSYGGNPLDRNTQNVEMFDFQNPELFRQRAMGQAPSQNAQNTGTTPGTTPGQTTTPASSGAATALGSGARSLKNRKPGLAGGFTGWSGDQSGSSNSNFNYFSRFA